MAMSNVWKMIQEKKGNRKTHEKKHKHILVPSQRYQDSRQLLQNPTFCNYVMGFSNRAQRFTGSNYLDVDSPLRFLQKLGFNKPSWDQARLCLDW